MIDLKNLIAELEEGEYKGLCDSLKKLKANKLYELVSFIRQAEVSDKKIQTSLKLSDSGFYALRSKLNQYIQEYLIDTKENPKVELFKQVSNIPTLLFETNRDTAKAVLKKLIVYK